MPRPKEGYRLKDGSEVPGCTTIISRFKEAGGLLYWAGKVGYEQGKAGQKFNLYEKREEAADIGTHAHALFEAHRGSLPEPPMPSNFTPEQKQQAETAYLNALEWANQVRLESVERELPLVCECYRYGCTIDEIVRVNNKLIDLEWKSSNSVYLDYLLQVAAQKHAWECNHPRHKLDGAGILRFAKEYGDFSYHYFTDLDEPFDQFVRFRDAFDVDKKLKRRVG